MQKFEVRFDCGNDDRSPAWVIVRFENLGSEMARFGQVVAEYVTKEAADLVARQLNINAANAKFTISPALVVE